MGSRDHTYIPSTVTGVLRSAHKVTEFLGQKCPKLASRDAHLFRHHSHGSPEWPLCIWAYKHPSWKRLRDSFAHLKTCLGWKPSPAQVKQRSLHHWPPGQAFCTPSHMQCLSTVTSAGKRQHSSGWLASDPCLASHN